jgi:hypothetical protein
MLVEAASACSLFVEVKFLTLGEKYRVFSSLTLAFEVQINSFGCQRLPMNSNYHAHFVFQPNNLNYSQTLYVIFI